uniref:Ig-like domain-containing protein n=1 Tax=Macrostomum lignano TaxID=282301 RepID=A0A1I8FDL7_9PLAT
SRCAHGVAPWLLAASGAGASGCWRSGAGASGFAGARLVLAPLVLARLVLRVSGCQQRGRRPVLRCHRAATPPSSPDAVQGLRAVAQATSLAISGYSVCVNEKPPVQLAQMRLSSLCPICSPTLSTKVECALATPWAQAHIPRRCVWSPARLPPNPPRIECVHKSGHFAEAALGRRRNADLLPVPGRIEMAASSVRLGVFAGWCTRAARHSTRLTRLAELTGLSLRIRATNEAGSAALLQSILLLNWQSASHPPAMKPPTTIRADPGQLQGRLGRPADLCGRDSIVYVLQLLAVKRERLRL